ncbi:MAG: MlaD family protein [Pseudolabrys sp.]|jgi:phospholipid/cholesterol/gamma-HCH transport system substrate-binding protein
METRANYVIIGLFTLAVVFGVFGFVYWFQNIGGTSERAYYSVVFDGSVSGLRTGATVLFNGIRVGEVTDLKLNPQRPKQVVAVLSIDKLVTVRRDTEVGLEFQGLTGIASVALGGGSPAAPALVGSKDNPPQLMAGPGAAQDVTQGARDTLRRIDDFIEQNQEAFHNALANLDKFSQALARNSDRIDNITEGLQTFAAGTDGKGGELFEAVHSIRTLSDHLDQRTEEITKGINMFTAAGTKQLNAIGADAHRMMGEVEKTVKNIDHNPSRLLFGGAPATGSK